MHLAVEALVHSAIFQFVVVELVDQYAVLVESLLWLRSHDEVAGADACSNFLSLRTEAVVHLSRHRAHVFRLQVVQRIVLHDRDQAVGALASMCLALVCPGDCVVLLYRRLLLHHADVDDGVPRFHGLNMPIGAFINRTVLEMVRILTLETRLSRHLEPLEVYQLPKVATLVNTGAIGLAIELRFGGQKVFNLMHRDLTLLPSWARSFTTFDLLLDLLNLLTFLHLLLLVGVQDHGADIDSISSRPRPLPPILSTLVDRRGRFLDLLAAALLLRVDLRDIDSFAGRILQNILLLVQAELLGLT